MTITTLHVSRRVCLPPLVAATAFDVLHLACATGDGSTMWALGAGSAVVVLSGTNVLPDHPTLPLRQASGRLRAMSGRRSYPVEVEVAAWSRLRSEVGVRLVGCSVPLDEGWRQRRYLGLAHAAADHLGDALEAVTAWGDRVMTEATAVARAASV